MRKIAALTVVACLLALAGYLCAKEYSGKVVASAPLYAHETNGIGEFIDAWRKNFILNTRDEIKPVVLVTDPFTVPASKDDLKIRTIVTEKGFVRRTSEGTPVMGGSFYYMMSDTAGRMLFNYEFKYGQGASSKSTSSTSIGKNEIPLGPTVMNYTIGTVRIVDTGEYVFSAVLDQRFLASSDMEIRVEFIEGAWEADPRVIFGLLGLMLACIGILVVTRTGPLKIIMKTK